MDYFALIYDQQDVFYATFSVWIGVDTERKAGIYAGVVHRIRWVRKWNEKSEKEVHLIRRIPWKKANPHE